MTAGGRNTGGVMRSSSAALRRRPPPASSDRAQRRPRVRDPSQLWQAEGQSHPRSPPQKFKKYSKRLRERGAAEPGRGAAGILWGSRLCLSAPRCLRNSDLRLILNQTSPETCGPPRRVASAAREPRGEEKRPLIVFWGSLMDETSERTQKHFDSGEEKWRRRKERWMWGVCGRRQKLVRLSFQWRSLQTGTTSGNWSSIQD